MAAKSLWRLPGTARSLDVLFVGDTAFGESYQDHRATRGRDNILAKYGYDHGFIHLDPLLSQVDLVVANLETPMTRLRSSPFEGIRKYLHYSDPEVAPKHLISHGIRAVTLANNHTHDFGEPGLIETLETLDRHGIVRAGAGRNKREAHRPLQIAATLEEPGSGKGRQRTRVSVFSAFHGGPTFRDTLKAYAAFRRPGAAELRIEELTRQIRKLRRRSPEEFVVVAPHWRRDYQWRSDRQAAAARALTAAGADLVIGHGSHMLQEIDHVNGRWVLNGVGNFIFNSAGRYRKSGAPPYSLMIRLTISYRERLLRAYPIMTDNRRNNYQPRPVTAAEADEVWELLAGRTNEPEQFARTVERGHDGDWHYLALHPGGRPPQ